MPRQNPWTHVLPGGSGWRLSQGFFLALWTGRSALLPILGETRMPKLRETPRPPPSPRLSTVHTAAVKLVIIKE